MTPPIDRAPSEAAVPHRRPRDLRSPGRHDRSTPARPDAASGARGAMTTVEITLLGRFAVTVDTVPVAEASWTRRQAAALVKILALAPGRRLHREQVIDLVWPEDTLDEAVPEAAQGRALRPSRARRARRRRAARRPRHAPARARRRPSTSCSSRSWPARPSPTGTSSRPGDALARYGGDLLPEDRYDDWAEERREQLRLRHLDLLRLDGRWEPAGRARRRRRGAPTSRSCNATPPTATATPPSGSSSASTRPCAASSASPRAAPRVELRDRLLADHDVTPRRRDELVGRDRELAVAERALDAAAAGRSRTLIISGPAGDRASRRCWPRSPARARELGLRIGHGTSAPVEGAWPYAPVVEAMADLCRRHPTLLDGLADQHRQEIDRVLAGAETVVVGRELAPAPLRGGGRAGPPGRGHERPAARPSTTCTTPTTPASACCTTSPGRRTTSRVCLVLTHRPAPAERDPDRDPPQPPRPPRRDRARARSPRSRTTSRRWSRRYVAGADGRAGRARSRPSAAACRSPSNELARRAARGAAVGAGLRRHHDRRHRARHPRGAPARRRRRVVLRHRRVRRPLRPARGRRLRPPRRRPRRAGRRADERRLPVPPRARP